LILANAAARQTKATKIDKIWLHVQISNEDGKRFYEQHGFAVVRVHNDYYRKLQPRDAWVLEKTVEEEEKDTAS
jgi:N-alpha-acetyltransferase 50